MYVPLMPWLYLGVIPSHTALVPLEAWSYISLVLSTSETSLQSPQFELHLEGQTSFTCSSLLYLI